MMYQSSGYDQEYDWASEGETEFKVYLLRGCLFWAFVYLAIPITVFLVGLYFTTS